MLHSNSIQSLLGIQDPNITFEENFIKEGPFKGKVCQYVLGKWTYNPTHCEGYGVRNMDYTVYKNETPSSRLT